MKLSNALVAAVGVGLASVSTVHAWGAVGHEIVGTIAQIHLHPSARATICDLLPERAKCHLAPVAAWADQIRNQRRWTGPLHYVNGRGDYPSQTCVFKEGDWMGQEGVNVLAAVRNVTTILDEGLGNLQEQSEALWFLVHFLGDMHMPLHLTGRDKGGNGDKVLWDGRTTNLHAVWDSKLISKSLLTIPRNYTRPLPSRRIESALRGTIYDPYIRRIMWEGVLGRYRNEIEEGDWTECPAPATPSKWQSFFFSEVSVPTDDGIVCPFHWAQPIHELNCAIVWPKELDEPPYSHLVSESFRGSDEEEHHSCSDSDVDEADLGLHANAVQIPTRPSEELRKPRQRYLELDTPKYSGRIAEEWIVERLLAQAGIRLAATLNYLYADPEAQAQEIDWS